MDDLIDIFDKVADCEYKGEHYSARDNGAVMRHPKTPNRPRPFIKLSRLPSTGSLNLTQ